MANRIVHNFIDITRPAGAIRSKVREALKRVDGEGLETLARIDSEF